MWSIISPPRPDSIPPLGNVPVKSRHNLSATILVLVVKQCGALNDYAPAAVLEKVWYQHVHMSKKCLVPFCHVLCIVEVRYQLRILIRAQRNVQDPVLNILPNNLLGERMEYGPQPAEIWVAIAFTLMVPVNEELFLYQPSDSPLKVALQAHSIL